MIGATGMLALALSLDLTDTVDATWVSVPVALVGLGGGLTLPGVIGTVLAGIRPDQAGAASGVLTTTQQFAGAAGVAVVGATYFATVPATDAALWIDFALFAATAVLTLLLRAPTPAPVLNQRL